MNRLEESVRAKQMQLINEYSYILGIKRTEYGMCNMSKDIKHRVGCVQCEQRVLE